MTDKDTNAKKPTTKKVVAKKAPAKKTAAKKAAPKAKPEVKEPVDTAPYLSKKTTTSNDKNSYIVPALLVLALSIVIVAVFYQDQVTTLVAKFNTNADTQETIATITQTTPLTDEAAIQNAEETATVTEEVADIPVTEEIVELIVVTPTEKVGTATEPKAVTTAPTQTALVKPSITTAPAFNARPSWAVANTPYHMGPAQSKAYNEMIAKQKAAYDSAMKKQYEMMVKTNEVQKAGFASMQKLQQDMQLKMQAMRQQSMKIQYEMDQKMKDAFNQYHAI